MPNPNDPDQAECQVCFDQGSPPGSYAPCSNCRPVDYEKYWAKQKGAPTAESGACLPHDDLTEQTLRDGLFICAACGSASGIEQPPVIEWTRVTPPGVDQ